MVMIRKDYILDRWVYYATKRGKRPHEFKNEEVKAPAKGCLFCPTNEHLTPPEIGRVKYKGSWKIRWFLNKYPAAEVKGKTFNTSKKYFAERNSYGVHEIIAETDHHKSQLADLPVEHIREILEVYKFRVKSLGRIEGIKYVQIFKNHGKDAGTSLVHSHSQVVALPHVPSLIKDEIASLRKYKKCPYCDIIKLEAKSKRKIFETENVVAFAPFASRFNYEAWIFTRQHKKNFEELSEKEFEDLALAMKKILLKLKKMNASYNFYVHYSPEKENLHFHIEITPRIAAWAGFEFSTGMVMSSVMPEDAAKYYRGK